MHYSKRLAVVLASIGIVLVSSYDMVIAASLGIIKADALNVRRKPNTDSQVVTKLVEGTKVSILESSNGWYKISFNEVKGWVTTKYVTVTEDSKQLAVVAASDVNLRSGASTDTKIIDKLSKGAQVEILSASNGWYNIKTNSGIKGWIFKDFLVIKRSSTSSRGVQYETRETIREGATTDLSSREQIVDYAKKFLGVRYVYGGTSPNGFDCSGFVQYVFKHFGIHLERVAANQAGNGVYINKSALLPGDIVLFDTDGGHNYINHVGIYIGNGSFIHASSGSRHRVIISELDSGFYANAYMTGRRLIR